MNSEFVLPTQAEMISVAKYQNFVGASLFRYLSRILFNSHKRKIDFRHILNQNNFFHSEFKINVHNLTEAEEMYSNQNSCSESGSKSTCPHQEKLNVTYLELTCLISSIDNLRNTIKTRIDHSQLKKLDTSEQILVTRNRNINTKEIVSANNSVCLASTKNIVTYGFCILRISLSKLFFLCSWMTKKIFRSIKQIFIHIRQIYFFNHYYSCNNCIKTQKMVQVVSLKIEQIEHNNNCLTFEASERFRLISDEFKQIKVKNDLQITNFREELQNAFKKNAKLIEDNRTLKDEISALKSKVNDIINNKYSIPVPAPRPSPPPPPPPLPPPFVPFINEKCLKDTISENKLKSVKDTKEKEMNQRISITVEDLKNIKLRKTQSEFIPKTSNATKARIVVTPAMLRSVKLRHVKNKFLDNTRSSTR